MSKSLNYDPWREAPPVPDPIPMVLHCPNCGKQHVDAPEPETGWDNPPHKSHKCHSCGTIWRPAPVYTNGVAKLESRGEADTWPPLVTVEVYSRPECIFRYCPYAEDCKERDVCHNPLTRAEAKS